MRFFLVVGLALLSQACIGGDDEGVQVCQADLLDKLKAPSTFKLVAAYRGEMPPINHADRIARTERLNEEKRARFDELSEADRYYYHYIKNKFIPEMKATDDPATEPSYAILLSYDAENSFGAPLRGHYWCRIRDDGEEEDWLFGANNVSGEELDEVKAMMEEVAL